MIPLLRKDIRNRIIFVLSFFIALSARHCLAEKSSHVPVNSMKWEATSLSAQELSQAINDKAGFLEKYVNDDERALQAHVNALKKELNDNGNILKKLRQELQDKQTLHEKLEIKFQDASSDMKTLEGTVRTAARQCLENLKWSPVTASHKNRLQPLEAFLSSQSFPSIEVISSISRALFEEIEQTGIAVTTPGKFIGLTGREQTGTIIRAGGFFLGFSDGENTGFLTSTEFLPVAKQGLPLVFSKKINAWLTGNKETLCMDITHGAALEAQARQRDFSQWFEAGGLLLWPIFAIASAGLFIILYKMGYLFTRRRLSNSLFIQIEQYLKANDLEKCKDLLVKMKRTPAATVLSNGIKFYNTSLDALDNSFQEARLNILARLERMLPLLAVFTAMAPLLGLLGTVTGMIATFQTITVFGTGDPRMLSTGISEALITTQAGLGVTIPFMLIHHLLKRRVNALMDDTEEAGAGLAALIADYQHSRKNEDPA